MDSSDNRKKGKFFYDIVVIQVEDTLHRIPRYHLERWSQTFKDMFQLPQDTSAEGSSTEHPINLPGCTNYEFESLLTVLFTPTLDLSKEQWISILKLATMWDMAELRKLAIEKLSALKLTPTEKVQLGLKYKVASWLVVGCTALIQDERCNSLDALGASAQIRFHYLCGIGVLPGQAEPSSVLVMFPLWDSIQVDVPTFGGSGHDAVSAAVKNVFAAELKTMY
ncbi:hypothetical protein MD484_g4354, partial [Candolleomyces efflorescens]